MSQKKSTKAETKEKKKTLEDKTFGLKNKNKSKKVKDYIGSLEKAIMKPKKGTVLPSEAALNKKTEKKKKDEEFAELFSVVEDTQKVPPGVDPKSVLCQKFKKGKCKKGDGCPFSHDLTLENKKARIDIYKDLREERGLLDPNRKGTFILCPHFLKAVEKELYGWFWVCPNEGDDCPYSHAIPEGYVFEEKKDPEKIRDAISLEEYVEVERAKLLDQKGELITEEAFKKWTEANPYVSNKPKKTKKSTGRDYFMQRPEISIEDVEEEGLDVDYSTREWDLDDLDSKLEDALVTMESLDIN